MIDLDHAANAARVDARRHLERQLDRLCADLGLDPWEAWRKPRQLAQLDRITAANAATRESARDGRPPVGGYLPLRDETGRFRLEHGRFVPGRVTSETYFVPDRGAR